MNEQPGLKCYSLEDNLLQRLVECVCVCVESLGLSAASQGMFPNVNCTDVLCCDPTPITARIWCRDQDCVLV